MPDAATATLLVTFSVPGPPAPFIRATGKRIAAMRDQYGWLNDPALAKYFAFSLALKTAAGVAYGARLPFAGQVALTVDIRVPNLSKRGLEPRRYDGANVYKGVEDACNKVVYLDDHQVVDGRFQFMIGDYLTTVNVWSV